MAVRRVAKGLFGVSMLLVVIVNSTARRYPAMIPFLVGNRETRNPPSNHPFRDAGFMESIAYAAGGHSDEAALADQFRSCHYSLDLACAAWLRLFAVSLNGGLPMRDLLAIGCSSGTREVRTRSE